jgi:hypothetical protein
VRAAGPADNDRPSSLADVFARRVEEKSPIAAVYLQKAYRIEQTGAELRIILPDATGFALLDTAEHRSVLNAAASELVGKDASVSLIIEDQRTTNRSGSRPEPENAQESAKAEPLVKRFLEVFRGDIAQIKPANGE